MRKNRYHFQNKDRVCHLCGKKVTLATSEEDDPTAIGNQIKKRICRECNQERFDFSLKKAIENKA